MAKITSIKRGAQKLRVVEDANSEVVSFNATGEPWKREAYGFVIQGEKRDYEVQLTAKEAKCFVSSWPDLAKAGAKSLLQPGRQHSQDAFIDKIAGLNPEAGEIGAGMLRHLIETAQKIQGDRLALDVLTVDDIGEPI